jgi:hypothetical protein
MKTCEIKHVKHADSFRWRWLHRRADGTVAESTATYALFYECVMAARASGYEPELKCA